MVIAYMLLFATDCFKPCTYLSQPSLQPCEGGAMIRASQMSETGVQPARKWQSQETDTGSSAGLALTPAPTASKDRRRL